MPSGIWSQYRRRKNNRRRRETTSYTKDRTRINKYVNEHCFLIMLTAFIEKIYTIQDQTVLISDTCHVTLGGLKHVTECPHKSLGCHTARALRTRFKEHDTIRRAFIAAAREYLQQTGHTVTLQHNKILGGRTISCTGESKRPHKYRPGPLRYTETVCMSSQLSIGTFCYVLRDRVTWHVSVISIHMTRHCDGCRKLVKS